MRDYMPWLSQYEKAVSRALNIGLRHHAGKISNHNRGFGLKCDDAVWVDIVEVLNYPFFWVQNHIMRTPPLYSTN